MTDRNEWTVRYEIGMMRDGNGELRAALSEFHHIRENAPSDSYYVMDASYEVARLSLALWLADPNAGNTSLLDSAASDFRLWLARDWNKLTTKLWGYYHGVCAYREKLKYRQQRGLPADTKDEDLLREYTDKFLALARSQKGVRKYEIKYTAFFLSVEKSEHFPGEPLKCGLQDLLAEFKTF